MQTRTTTQALTAHTGTDTDTDTGTGTDTDTDTEDTDTNARADSVIVRVPGPRIAPHAKLAAAHKSPTVGNGLSSGIYPPLRQIPHLHTYSCVAAAAADVSALAPKLLKYSSVSACPLASASGVSPVMTSWSLA